MKVTSISRKAFEGLEKINLSNNVRNTEAVMYHFITKKNSSKMVLKKMHY